MQDNFSLARFYAIEAAGPKGFCPPGWSWETLMELALEQAHTAAENQEVPVGAVLADNRGKVIAQAGNRVERDSNPAAHAEILAIQAAARLYGPRNLNHCVLVVTLEPCLMCAAAIALSRIGGVVFGAADKRAGSLVSAADAASLPLAGRKFWHLGGICADKSVKMLRDFFNARRNLAVP